MAVTTDDSQSDRSTLRLTLENVSNLPVDFLRLSFDDSTIGPAQAALAEGDLSIYDAYETEYQLEARIEELHAELEGTTPVTSERRFLEVIPAAARGQIV